MDAQPKPLSEGTAPARAPLDVRRSLGSQILDCIGHAVAVVDLEGRINFWNKFSESLFGWSEEQALGRQLLPLLVPDEGQQAQLRAAMGQRQQGKAWVGEIVLRRQDGTTFFALVANTPLFAPGGEVIGRIVAATDISERKAAEESMRESQAHLRALANRLVTVREAEATRIAREIHDQMGQALTAVKMDIAALLLDVEAPGDAAKKLGARIVSISEVVQSALETATKLCRELRPPVLDNLGLVAALEWAARDFEARSGIFCNVHLPAETSVVDAERATVVFRIFQEMLTNILRHAEATEVTIRLSAEKDILRLEVTDNGRGFSPKSGAIPAGLGVIGMRERALSVGGILELRRQESGGTRATLEIPN